jgi:26-hydroxylase
VDGHLIPANSHVIPNLYAIHMDPEVWPQPEAFQPERFIHPDTGKVYKPKNFLPFGTGQRMCLGDSLAEIELQLFFASMMHVFDIDSVDGAKVDQLPSLEGNFGATLTPSDFKVKLTPRNVEALIAANNNAAPANYLHMRTYG